MSFYKSKSKKTSDLSFSSLPPEPTFPQLKKQSFEVSLEDDYIYKIFAVNRYNQSVMVAIEATQKGADGIAEHFKNVHREDRYWRDKDDNVLVYIEKKLVPNVETKTPLMKSPRE